LRFIRSCLLGQVVKVVKLNEVSACLNYVG